MLVESGVIQMDQNNQNSGNQGTSQTPKELKKVTTTVTCPHCHKSSEITVEILEGEETPKLFWSG